MATIAAAKKLRADPVHRRNCIKAEIQDILRRSFGADSNNPCQYVLRYDLMRSAASSVNNLLQNHKEEIMTGGKMFTDFEKKFDELIKLEEHTRAAANDILKIPNNLAVLKTARELDIKSDGAEAWLIDFAMTKL